MLARRLIATAAITAGLGIGLTAPAQAAPAPAQTQSAAVGESGSVVRPHASGWQDKGYFNSLSDCQRTGMMYIAIGWASRYYCAPMTDEQHYELSVLHNW